jgi:hypothetical protein
VILARRNGEVRYAFHTQFVPHLGQILAFVDLHFVRHNPRTEPLVERVLKVPARLRLLHEFANCFLLCFIPIGSVLDNSPDFEILKRIASLIF